ncbi:alpha/beta hydrolase [Crocosphaera sp.]|uniref:alpha/beta hydrolase n=1 Tax=Crocosphaera sp. TaxID=2729996 RepID=UPI002636381E|nr:alpha/beta hydrolase [Crocosphaera sp.]MDJ0582285.1 alpha/beta hydrolase [Crocosphaera sp.]
MNETIAPVPRVEEDSTQKVDGIKTDHIQAYLATSTINANVDDSSNNSEQPRLKWEEITLNGQTKSGEDTSSSQTDKNPDKDDRLQNILQIPQNIIVSLISRLNCKKSTLNGQTESEQDTSSSQTKENSDKDDRLGKIATFLSTSKANELVIMIHGYKTEKESAKEQYKERFNFINSTFSTLWNSQKSQPENNRKLVIIGYTWPSEDFLKGSWKGFWNACCTAFRTLPIPFEIINDLLFFVTFLIFDFIFFFMKNQELWYLWYIIFFCFLFLTLLNLLILIYELFSSFSISRNNKLCLRFVFFVVIIIYFLVLLFFNFNNLNCFGKLIMWLGLVVWTLYFGVVVTLIFLRVTAYFRDKYRAMFFGVADLVDLIQKLDRKIKDKIESKNKDDIHDIKLSFIAHSMGAFVATHTIRTLCDAFENGQTNDSETDENNKNNRIGRHFLLERLVLVAPDISVQAIFPGKSNVLETAIDKCKEAYLFSNQGDMVLRVFSMISNYFRFPASCAERGFRLGNIVVYDKTKSNQCYQTLNPHGNIDKTKFLSNLHIVCRGERKSLFELLGSPKFQFGILALLRGAEKFGLSLLWVIISAFLTDGLVKKQVILTTKNIVTTQVTYFDCTDCEDKVNNENAEHSDDDKLILSTAKNHQIIPVWQCLGLLRQWIFNKHDSKIDIHGGYFNGKFCQTLIYGLACLGWDDFNDFCKPRYNQHPSCQESENYFLPECQTRHIQVLLSTQRG